MGFFENLEKNGRKPHTDKESIDRAMADPRIAKLKHAQPQGVKLMIHLAGVAMAQIGVLEASLDDLFPVDSDLWRTPIGDRHTLLDFNGHTAAGLWLNGHSDELIQQVRDAYATNGMTFPEGQRVLSLAHLRQIGYSEEQFKRWQRGYALHGLEFPKTHEPQPASDVQPTDAAPVPAPTTDDALPVVSPADTLVPTPRGDRRPRVSTHNEPQPRKDRT